MSFNQDERSRRARSNHLSGHRTAVLAVLIDDGAVDDCVFDTFRGHHEAASAAGQIVLHLRALRRIDSVVVEQRHVGLPPGLEASALANAKEVGWLGGDALDRALERDRLATAHPVA